jgi:hypothetical protein
MSSWQLPSAKIWLAWPTLKKYLSQKINCKEIVVAEKKKFEAEVGKIIYFLILNQINLFLLILELILNHLILTHKTTQ